MSDGSADKPRSIIREDFGFDSWAADDLWPAALTLGRPKKDNELFFSEEQVRAAYVAGRQSALSSDAEHPDSIALRAWHSVFETSQLSHAHARLQAAEEKVARLTRPADAEQVAGCTWYSQQLLCQQCLPDGVCARSCSNRQQSPFVAWDLEAVKQEIRDLFARYGSGHYEPTEEEKEIIEAGLDEILTPPPTAAPSASAEPVPAYVIVQRHRRHVELSPGAGEEAQRYALAVCDDIINDLLPSISAVSATAQHKEKL